MEILLDEFNKSQKAMMALGKKNANQNQTKGLSENEFLDLGVELEGKSPGNIDKNLFRDYWLAIFEFMEELNDNVSGIKETEDLLDAFDKKQRKINLKLLSNEINKIDDSALIEAKKAEFALNKTPLKRHRECERSIMTVLGYVSYVRKALIRSDRPGSGSASRPKKEALIFPLDDVLGITKLSFKLTSGAMLEILKRVVATLSYRDACALLRNETSVVVNDVTMRSVTNELGKIVFDKESEEVRSFCERRPDSFPKPQKGPESPAAQDQNPEAASSERGKVLYLALSDSRLHLRENSHVKPKVNSSFKLGLVFSSEHIINLKESGSVSEKIVRKEFVPYLGEAKDFIPYLLYAAGRYAYDNHSEVVILGNGSPWIKDFKETFFPKARLLVDFGYFKDYLLNVASPENIPVIHRILKEIRKTPKKSSPSGPLDVKALFQPLIKNLPNKKKRKLRDFLANNLEALRYGEALASNILIGLGEKETGEVTFLHERLRQKGMRWSRESGQYVLTLTAKNLSGLWEKDVVTTIRDAYG
jgi:hypothetical protein